MRELLLKPRRYVDYNLRPSVTRRTGFNDLFAIDFKEWFARQWSSLYCGEDCSHALYELTQKLGGGLV